MAFKREHDKYSGDCAKQGFLGLKNDNESSQRISPQGIFGYPGLVGWRQSNQLFFFKAIVKVGAKAKNRTCHL